MKDAPVTTALGWPRRTAVVLLNLGTPQAPTAQAVRPYLREFLMDGRIIDLHPVARWLLVNGLIAPFRAPRSAAKYASIWMKEGSPLLVHSRALTQQVAAALPGVEVVLAMRYGQPSIAQAVAQLDAARVSHVVLVPLFPQYSSAAWGSAVEAFQRALCALRTIPSVAVVPPFFDEPGFVAAFAERLKATLAASPAEHVVFSYHGLPYNQAKASCRDGECPVERPGACCERLTAANRTCYRAQCLATTRLLAQAAGVTQHSTVFQSRLGRAVWLGPYLDPSLEALAKAGVRRVAVACPAFVADCLETLEEVGLGSREVFLRAGGEALTLVPSLNAGADWAQTVTELARRHLVG